MIKVVQAVPEHIKSMHDAYRIGDEGSIQEEQLVRLTETGMAFSGVDETGKVYGVAGIVKVWTGVGNAWSFLSSDVRAAKFFLHRNVKRELERIIKEAELHRVQLDVEHDFTIAHQWAERLGFSFEGVMFKYGPDKKDYHRYVRLE